MDAVGKSFFYDSGILPPLVLLGTLILLRRLRIARRLTVGLLLAIAFFAFLFGSSYVMALRDGLGPDMEAPSRGWLAIERAMPGMIIVSAVAVIVAAFAFWLAKRKHEEKA